MAIMMESEGRKLLLKDENIYIDPKGTHVRAQLLLLDYSPA